jgi:hypothetical protein
MPATARSLHLLLVLALVATLGAIAAAPVAATHPGANGRLAVACDDGLWAIDADGSDLALITDQEVLQPAWSPGGNFFAFSRRATLSSASLWTMDADGTDQRRHTYTNTHDIDPEWTPDGQQIIFASDKPVYGSAGPLLWSYEPGRNESHHNVIAAQHTHDPAPAPDNLRMAWVRKQSGTPQAVVITSDYWTDVVVAPPPSGATDEGPDWAPDGTRYLFVRLHDGLRSVWAVDDEGTDLDRLTDESVDVLSPRYSPDGTTIAYLARPAAAAGTGAPYGLWTMGADGGEKAEVATGLACDHLTWQPVPDFPLVDARFSPFELEIEWAFAEGITTGCTVERFCPANGISREQMASFLARALDLPAAVEDHFTDDETSIHEENINRIADAGITTGCGGTTYCPRQGVSREQMASFLARALELPAATEDHFTDDEDSIHEENINRVADAGVTTGCGGTSYCPRDGVTRGQMVAFLHRALAP